MGQVHKIGDEYFIEFYARGLLYQQKAGTDYQRAVKMLLDVESKIQAGEMGTVVRDVDWDIFIKTFLDQAKEKHTLKTFQRFNDVIEYFQKFLSLQYPQFKKLSSITPVVIENFRSYMIGQSNLKGGLINFTLVLLDDILLYAVKLGYLNDHPMVHTKWIEASYRLKISYFDEQQLREFKSKLSTDAANVFEVMCLTGLSLMQLQTLSWQQIDFSKNVIMVANGNSTKNQRSIPIALPVREILQLYKEKLFSLSVPELKSISPFMVRNSFAYFALKQGIRLADLYLMMGFDDVVKVMRYFGWVIGAKRQ